MESGGGGREKECFKPERKRVSCAVVTVYMQGLELRGWSEVRGVVFSFPLQTGKLRLGEIVNATADTWGARA